MNVYLLVHDDRDHDMGETSVRGVYTTREAAEAAIVTRTASGKPSTAYGAHSAGCCSVDEWETDGPAAEAVMPDAPPRDPDALSLMPPDFLRAVELNLVATNPWRLR